MCSGIPGRDKSVEVNQRALIDKVLARYSGEFTGGFSTIFIEGGYLNVCLQFSVNCCRLQTTPPPGGVEIRFEIKKYIDRSHSNESGTAFGERTSP